MNLAQKGESVVMETDAPKRVKVLETGAGAVFPVTRSSLSLTIYSEAKQYDFRIDYLQKYESESKSEIRGEVSMWI